MLKPLKCYLGIHELRWVRSGRCSKCGGKWKNFGCYFGRHMRVEGRICQGCRRELTTAELVGQLRSEERLTQTNAAKALAGTRDVGAIRALCALLTVRDEDLRTKKNFLKRTPAEENDHLRFWVLKSLAECHDPITLAPVLHCLRTNKSKFILMKDYLDRMEALLQEQPAMFSDETLRFVADMTPFGHSWIETLWGACESFSKEEKRWGSTTLQGLASAELSRRTGASIR
jgi:hypothetical protein